MDCEICTSLFFHVGEILFPLHILLILIIETTMRSFASDNNSGVHPLVMEALNQANQDHAVGYGDDAWTEEAVRKIREAFTPDCEPLFVFNGTGSNAVALQLCTRSYNSIICAERAYLCRRVWFSRPPGQAVRYVRSPLPTES